VRLIGFIFVAGLFIGCTGGDPGPRAVSPASLYDKGRTVYLSACSVCHNVDPTREGSIGPAIFGSSLQLLERRVIFGDYPPAYTPKRQSKAMVALPHLKDQVPALYAYLNGKK